MNEKTKITLTPSRKPCSSYSMQRRSLGTLCFSIPRPKTSSTRWITISPGCTCPTRPLCSSVSEPKKLDAATLMHPILYLRLSGR